MHDVGNIQVQMYDSSCVDGTDCLFNSSNVGLKDAAVLTESSSLRRCQHCLSRTEKLLAEIDADREQAKAVAEA